jgi:hypothetical protein
MGAGYEMFGHYSITEILAVPGWLTGTIASRH